MPATNFTPIQLYRTNTASTTAPAAGNLNAGELAINYNDGGMILFAKNTTGTVIKLMNNPASLLYPTADGTNGQVITTNGSGTLSFTSVAAGDVTAAGNNAFTGANTFYNATGQTFSRTSANDGIVLQGRSGGTSSYRVTFTTGTLSASRTVTLPNADINFTTGLGVANGGTGATTLTANNVILGNGTSAVQFVAPGTNGNVLTSNGTTWSSTAPAVSLSAAQTFTALQTFSGSTSVAATKLANAKEVATISATAATGTINYDITTQSVLYYTSNASANWTVNFRGSSGTSLDTLMSTGESMTVAFLVTQGATAYYNSAVQVDGSSVTPKWQGGTAPSAGNASSIDAYVYTIVKTGSATFTVFASQTQFK